MKFKAVQKFAITSPKKLRMVVPLVKELTPKEAFDKLPFVKKRAALPLRKVIGAAIANAKQVGTNEEDLVFSEIQIGEGPMLKRWRAGARGRAKPYKRRMSHILVVLETREEKDTSTAGGKIGKSKTSRTDSTNKSGDRRKGDKTQIKSA